MLILPDWLVTTATVEPMTGHGLRVVDGRVDEVGPYEALVAAHPDDPVVPAPDRIALPGFVNAHVHLYGVLAHGIPVDAAPDGFWSFLDDYWWPKVEDALDVDMIVIAADWVCAELLKSGVTTFYDILEAPNALPDALLAEKEVVERRGIRAGDILPSSGSASELAARIAAGEALTLIRPGRDFDDQVELPALPTDLTTQGRVPPDDGR